MTEPSPGTPVLFIHGLWLHHSSWSPWVDLFSDRGFDALAPAWPGERDTPETTRTHPWGVADYSLDEITAHFAELARLLPSDPVLVGHSAGGLIVQRLLAEGIGSAAVVIDSPLDGTLAPPLADLRVGLELMGSPANAGYAIGLTDYQFRYAFARHLDPDESAALHAAHCVPAPLRPLFEVPQHPLPGASAVIPDDVPLLVIRSEATSDGPDTALERIEVVTLERSGHSLVIDRDWRRAADATLDWLDRQGIGELQSARAA